MRVRLNVPNFWRRGAVLPENLAASAASLTERPRRVLDLMMDGMNDAAIAERLNLSERTVQVYRAQIYKAYGVHSVKQFALLIPRALKRRSVPLMPTLDDCKNYLRK